MRILVADDHGIVRSGIRLLLERQPGLDVVAEAADGVEAVEQALAARPDLCILDVGMPRMTGLQAAREIRSHLKDVRVLMLSMHDDEHYLFEALKAGASGYVLKREADQDLVGAVHAVGRGEAFLTNAAERSIIRHWMEGGTGGPAVSLTPREEEVVKLIAEAYTNAQIAEILHLAEKTVESHRANVLRKLGMRDRVELVRYAIRRGSRRGLIAPSIRVVRAPVDHIAAPPFPPRLEWVGAAPKGFPMLLEFWDFCRVQSLRTLPYTKAWRERYAGLTVVGVHTAGFPPSQHPDAVRDAVARLEVTYPVAIDTEYEVWEQYGNLGWPARYLFDQRGILLHYHYGEGGYEETELAIQELLGLDAAGARAVPTPRRRPTPASSRRPTTSRARTPVSYTAGGVSAVLDGNGTVQVNGRTIAVEHPGCYELIAHERSTTAELTLEVGAGVTCYAVCFTPGLAS